MASVDIRSKILTEYSIKRQKIEAECMDRIAKIHSEHPRLLEIDKEINILGSKNIVNIMKDPKNTKKYNEKLKKDLEKLSVERKKYILENNIDENYKIPDYKCKKCQDRAILKNGNMCSCYNQRLIDELYNISNMGEVLKNQKFENFSFDYYSEEIPKNKKKSPKDNMKSAFEASKKFCTDEKDKRRNLLFYGQVGQGKTFLSSAIARELLKKGEEVMYIRAPKLFNYYEDYKFGRLQDKDFLNRIYNCDLLIIDDLGTENNNKMSLSFLYDLIDERISRKNSIIINTNHTMSELSTNYTKRFTSRLAENFIIYEFYGEDIRIQKIKNIIK